MLPFDWAYFVPFSRYSKLFVGNRNIFPPTCIWRHRWNFIKIFGVKNLNSSLSCGVVSTMLCFAVLKELQLVTDRRTDTRHSIYRASISLPRKNVCLGLGTQYPCSQAVLVETNYDILSTRSTGTMHTAAKACLISVALRLYIRIREPDRHQKSKM